jgi:hypothetical protein
VRDQLIEGLPALPQRRIHLLMGAVAKARHPAFGAKRGGNLDHQACLAEPAGTMHQPAGRRTRCLATPSDEIGLHARDVNIRYNRVLGLQ